jgi:hypothetical protein
MLTVATPYLHVQAIRRMYADQGKPTIAKPAWYSQAVNLTGTAAGEERRETLDMDRDSDFVLLSVYHYYQNGPYNPDVGSVAANAESGQFLCDSATFSPQPNIMEVRLMPLTAQRPLHSLDFISNAFCDFIMWSGLGNGFSFDWEVGQYPAVGIAHPFEGENNAPFGFSALSVWRGWLTEPLLLPAEAEIQIGVRRTLAGATIPLKGHLFLLWGVRLYVGGA